MDENWDEQECQRHMDPVVQRPGHTSINTPAHPDLVLPSQRLQLLLLTRRAQKSSTLVWASLASSSVMTLASSSARTSRCRSLRRAATPPQAPDGWTVRLDARPPLGGSRSSSGWRPASRAERLHPPVVVVGTGTSYSSSPPRSGVRPTPSASIATPSGPPEDVVALGPRPSASRP